PACTPGRAARGGSGEGGRPAGGSVPELPEVETLRQDLDKEVGGRKVKSVEVRTAKVVRRHRNRKEFAERLGGPKLGSPARLGNLLLLGLDGGPQTAAL